MIHLTKQTARRYLLEYQNLSRPRKMETDEEILGFICKVGCIQYDPLNKVAKNADLVLQSRCKNYTEETLYRLLYEKRELIDGWDKNMSIWAVSDWPCFARKRAWFTERYQAGSAERQEVRNDILHTIKTEGYVSSREVYGNRKVDWAWAPTDIGRAALESMYHGGELVIHHKEGTRKYYGLTEELLPPEIVTAPDPNTTLEEHQEWYVNRRIASVGLMWNKSGDAWLGMDLKKEERTRALESLLQKGEVAEITLDGMEETFYMPRASLNLLDGKEDPHEAVILAPLDNLLWDRKLIGALFGFDYKWEVYTPAADRKYGYYVLPLLYQDRFIARFEPVANRKSGELVVENWWWEQGVTPDQEMTAALKRCLSDFVRFLNLQALVPGKALSKAEWKWMENCL